MRHSHGTSRALAAAALGCWMAASPVLAQETGLGAQEDHPTLTLPEAQPHWVYIVEPVFANLIVSKVWLLDADTLTVKGMLSGGAFALLAMQQDNSELYLSETYWSRGSRGDRTDLVTFYDAKSLEPAAEVKLPNGRFLVVQKKPNLNLTADGRYLLSMNMDPAQSVSVVDVRSRSYVGEIESGGCSLTYPTGPSSFAMICPDGSFAHVTFDAAGKTEIEDGEPFFDSENDPVFEHAAMNRPTKQAFFISYDGVVYPTKLEGRPQVGASWRLQGPDDAGWRPGGWQLSAYHAGTNRLFVLMHQGGKWTHKKSGEEVWVFDAATGKRIQRVPLEHHAASINVSQDDKPLLYALTETASLQVFDATTYKLNGIKEGLGISPYVLYTPNE